MKSRDILIGCPGTFLFLGECVALGHAALAVSGSGSGFDSSGLAVLVGVDGQFAEDLVGVAVDDGTGIALTIILSGIPELSVLDRASGAWLVWVRPPAIH